MTHKRTPIARAQVSTNLQRTLNALVRSRLILRMPAPVALALMSKLGRPAIEGYYPIRLLRSELKRAGIA